MATMATTVLEVEAVLDAGEVRLDVRTIQNNPNTNVQQDLGDLVPGEQAATAHGATGRRRLTGAQHHGQRGGVAAHAHPQTGQAGPQDPGAPLRRGQHGQVALLAQRRPASEPLL
jgi:hypothetical protein